MTIVEFVEKITERELLPYQKEFVEECYKAAKSYKRVICIPPRGSNKFFLEYLQAIVIVVVGQSKFCDKDGGHRVECEPVDSIVFTGGALISDGMIDPDSCKGCKHDSDPDIHGSFCHMCRRNTTDHRIDWYEKEL